MSLRMSMPDRHIEVNAMAVRHALARSFIGIDHEGHAWRGTTGVGDSVVTVDVEATDAGDMHVHVWAPAIETGPLDARLARVLACENGELVLGRMRHRDNGVVVEHTILAGTTMDAVEVQSSVWAVGWAAAAWAPRLRALLTDAVPVPPAPQTPAGRLRDAADHVEMTTRRVKRYLDERYGGFQHHPDWGFHGAFGSARVFVDVLPVLDDSTAVRASAPVLSDIDLSDGLAVKVVELTAADTVRRVRPPRRPPRAVVPARDPWRRPRPGRARGGDRHRRRRRRRLGRPPGRGVRRPALRRPRLSANFARFLNPLYG